MEKAFRQRHYQKVQERSQLQSSAPVAQWKPIMTHHVMPAHAYQRALSGSETYTAADILSLQRTIGNQAVQRLLARTARSGVFQPSSRAEMQTPITTEHLATAQMSPTSQPSSLPQQSETLPHKENTTGLPDHLKTGIESLSGLSLDDVHVHYNATQPAQMEALAYTQGTEIYLGPGQEQHLKHEAWHVVQQKQGRVLPNVQARGAEVNLDQELEREADTMGKQAWYMRPVVQDGQKTDSTSTHSPEADELDTADSHRFIGTQSQGTPLSGLPLQFTLDDARAWLVKNVGMGTWNHVTVRKYIDEKKKGWADLQNAYLIPEPEKPKEKKQPLSKPTGGEKESKKEESKVQAIETTTQSTSLPTTEEKESSAQTIMTTTQNTMENKKEESKAQAIETTTQSIDDVSKKRRIGPEVPADFLAKQQRTSSTSKSEKEQFAPSSEWKISEREIKQKLANATYVNTPSGLQQVEQLLRQGGMQIKKGIHQPNDLHVTVWVRPGAPVYHIYLENDPFANRWTCRISKNIGY